jgi:hypothetical protein
VNVVAVEAPLNLIVAPLAPGPLIIPEKLNVCAADENVTLTFDP